jgi:two-component system sensor histidine kinase UhpB
VPDDKAIHVYRVLQEALNNVAKHSQTNEAWVRMQFFPEQLRLEVEDHGVGMNGSSGRGLGLIAMRERAELLHGSLDVSPAQSGGTLVCLEVPLDEKPL